MSLSLRVLGILALASAGVVRAQDPAPDPIADAIARVRPTAAEERWRALSWHTSLTVALAEARAAGKPVFLFAYDGTLDDGNC